MIYNDPIIKLGGDHSIQISFGDERSLRLNKLVRIFTEVLKKEISDRIVELLPTYSDLTIFYNPSTTSYQDLIDEIERLRITTSKSKNKPKIVRLLIVPVCYEGEYAPDIEYICGYNNIEYEEAISLHTSSPYYVFQLGFTPGCPFIGPLQTSLHVPLMQTPRTDTPEGAVAVSIGQTVIYPKSSPGGMRIIGRTPVRLFQIDHPEFSLFRPGDWVKFEPISTEKFKKIKTSISNIFDGVRVKSYEGEKKSSHP